MHSAVFPGSRAFRKGFAQIRAANADSITPQGWMAAGGAELPACPIVFWPQPSPEKSLQKIKTSASS